MLKDKLKSILPLLGGSGIGIFLGMLLFKSPIPEPPTPEYRVSLKNGLIVIPGDFENQASSIRYRIDLEGQKLENTISPTDSIFLDFQWSERVQTIDLEYLDKKNKVIGTHQSRIGDGIILDDLIIISKGKKEPELQ